MRGARSPIGHGPPLKNFEPTPLFRDAAKNDRVLFGVERSVELVARLGGRECDRDAQAAFGIKSNNHVGQSHSRCAASIAAPNTSSPLGAKAPAHLLGRGEMAYLIWSAAVTAALD